MISMFMRLLCRLFDHDWWESSTGNLRCCRCCGIMQTRHRQGEHLTADDKDRWTTISA